MDDKLTTKGSTRKCRSNWYVALSDERREEPKKRERETCYRKNIAKKSLLLEIENQEKETENRKDESSHTSHVKDKCNPKQNQYAMLLEEKKGRNT